MPLLGEAPADGEGPADDEGPGLGGPLGVARAALATGLGEADVTGDVLATGLGDGVRTGNEAGSWLGAVAYGTSTAIPARIATPATTPVNRPSRIGRLLDTRRRVPVREGAGRVSGVAATLMVAWGVSSTCSGPGSSRRP